MIIMLCPKCNGDLDQVYGEQYICDTCDYEVDYEEKRNIEFGKWLKDRKIHINNVMLAYLERDPICIVTHITSPVV